MILSKPQAAAIYRAMCAINAIDEMFSIAFKAPPHFYQVSEATFGGSIDVARYDKDGRYTGRETFEDRAEFAKRYGVEDASATHEKLVEIAKQLALATEEGDDAAQSTHYVDKQGRIRCKGSFLDLVGRARAVTAKIEGA